MGQGPTRHDAFGHLQPNLQIRVTALPGDQGGAEERGDDHQGQRGPEPDHLTHPEEQGDLNEGDDHEGDEQYGPNSHNGEDTGPGGLPDGPT